jgi:hypothetical protein
MPNLQFSFEDLSAKDKAAQKVIKLFKKSDANVAQIDINPTIKKTSGIAYREMSLTFVDSQVVVMRIKETGDIYQVLINRKEIPIKNQSDQDKAVIEIAQAMNRGRAAFQKKMAQTKAILPSSMKTAAPKIESALTEYRDSLKAEIELVKADLSELGVK